jgi:hypothetical protein
MMGGPHSRRNTWRGVRAAPYDQAGFTCKPVDVSLANRAKTPTTSCGWFLQVKDSKFVPFPKSGAGPTTTTAAPSS